MYLEEKELEEEAKFIGDIFGQKVSVEINEEKKTITFKVESPRKLLESLLKELGFLISEPKSLKFEEKVESDKGILYKINWRDWAFFRQEVENYAKTLNNKIWRLEEFLSKSWE